MADSEDIDLYAILGVSKRASISDIKKVRMIFAKSFVLAKWNVLPLFVF